MASKKVQILLLIIRLQNMAKKSWCIKKRNICILRNLFHITTLVVSMVAMAPGLHNSLDPSALIRSPSGHALIASDGHWPPPRIAACDSAGAWSSAPSPIASDAGDVLLRVRIRLLLQLLRPPPFPPHSWQPAVRRPVSFAPWSRDWQPEELLPVVPG